ncbi:MAG: hypothetical protein HRF43_08645 [Phycisphaerae bacterium]
MSRKAFAAIVLLIGGITGGCVEPQSQPPSSRPPAPRSTEGAPITNTDPCATRLHDICGPLLLYYARRHQLPARLEELSGVPGFEEIKDFTCPVSGRPYVYDPAGTISSAPPSRVILYDPAPSHSGLRWAVSIIEPEGDGPLVTKVIALQESYFTRRAGPASP